jgi:hypothetical protein
VTSISILTLLLLLPTLEVRAEETIDESTPARAIASLTDPKKIATLKGERASNPRLQKCLYWVEVDQRAEGWNEVYPLIIRALELNGEKDTPYGNYILGFMYENYRLANQMGLFTSEGMNELRQGKSATITKGKYAGQEATADHFIPRSVCPELDNQIFNLRLLPSSQNASKGDKVERKHMIYAEGLNKAGLLSAEGLEAVKKAYEKEASAQPPQTTESEDEKQVRMNEESKQMELELVRAERKGARAVYELWKERTTQQAERANKSKSSSDVLLFEKMVNLTLEALSRFIDQRGFTYRLPSDNPNSAGQEVSKSYMIDEETRRLESLIDASLREK